MRELHRWWWGLIGQDQLYNLHKAYKWWLTQCQCHNFTFFQGYTLYIQLENAIPLGHLQVAISQKRKELPENHWSTERMLPNFLFHVHNTYVYIHHTYICTVYTMQIIFGNVNHEIWRIMMPLNQPRDPCLTENRCINAQWDQLPSVGCKTIFCIQIYI